jgi:hypothetical protein
MTQLAQFDGTQVQTSDSGWQYHWGWDNRVSVVDDPGNPLGTGKAMHFAWDTGVSVVGLANLNSFGRSYKEIYIMYRIKYDPNWEKIGHKNFYFGTALENRGGKNASQYYITHDYSSGTGSDAQFVQQWANPTSTAFRMQNAWTGKYGRYVNMEIHAIAESSPGAGDGAVYYWHDGVLLGSNTNFAWTDASDLVAGFDGFHWYAARNDANTRDSWFRVGELYIAGR